MARGLARRLNEGVDGRAVQVPIGANTAAHVHAERLYAGDRVGNIACAKAARKEDRNGHGVADGPAHRPVVHASGSAELLHGRGWIARIEEDRIDEWGDASGRSDRARVANMND